MPHSTYLREMMGSATVEPKGCFEAGSFQEFTVTYTAGRFGIDDTGSIKIAQRFASDMARPQFDDPTAANYVSVEASNGAVLHAEYDMKRNIRPWDKVIYIKIVRGFLRDGDQIIIRYGDRRQGSPGIRIQTFCEQTFEFRVLVDAFATCDYAELPDQPFISISAGEPVSWKAYLPTQRNTKEPFKFSLIGEDKWGNPTALGCHKFRLRSTSPIKGLPNDVVIEEGQYSVTIDHLSVDDEADLVIEVLDQDKNVITASNPLRIIDESVLLPYWADLHGQSEETIGTNSIEDYFNFARDKAFLDACIHQGNDFQITDEFWQHLNNVTQEFNVPDDFVTFPGYEWSGNTGMGGDRNVFYKRENRPIYRSSRALVPGLANHETDAFTAEDLFKKLETEDCVVHAHIGGRYADIVRSHDGKSETSVEVHSAWGTFEWIIRDAFEKKYRVGIVANSDDHKGRPGASHPGGSKFGSYGGLTCLLADKFNRDGLFEALRARHHYATTGCRMHLEVKAEFNSDAHLYYSDPDLGPSKTHLTRSAIMGDILQYDGEEITLHIDILGSAPIERVEIRDGPDLLEVYHPYKKEKLGRRIRVIWQGSEYRGRGRETVWDGFAELDGNKFNQLNPINRHNIDKKFEQISNTRVDWRSLTTGGFGGFEAQLSDIDKGLLRIHTDLIKAEILIKDIGKEDTVFEAGGLDRKIRIFRLPDVNTHYSLNINKKIKLRADGDTRPYICITQEDGHQIWSSPIYVFNKK